MIRTREPQDGSANCTAWAAAGECKRNAKHMLKECRVACNVTHGEVAADASNRRLPHACPGYAHQAPPQPRTL